MPGWGRVSPHHRPTIPRVQRSLAVTLATDSILWPPVPARSCSEPLSHHHRSPSSSRGTPKDPGAAAHPAHLGAQTPRSPLASGSPSPGTSPALVPRSPCGLHVFPPPLRELWGEGPTGTPVHPSTTQHPAQDAGHPQEPCAGLAPPQLLHRSRVEVKTEGHGPTLRACGAQASQPRELGASSRMR